MSGNSGNSAGWEQGERVSVWDPNRVFAVDLDPVVKGNDNPVAWPSDRDPVLWLDLLSGDEADRLAGHAREQLFLWMAGAGLNPVDVLFRWTMAAARFLPGWRMEKGVMSAMNARGSWEKWVVARLFPGKRVAAELARIDGVLRRCSEGGRYVVLRDGRTLEELVDWVAVESLEVPSDVVLREARRVVDFAMASLCRWMASDRAGELAVCQRFYGMAFERYRLVAPSMTGSDLAGLLGQVRATFCEMTKRFFEEPLELLLGYVPKVPGQKSAESAEGYAANAAAHCPARMLGGNAGVEGDLRHARQDESEARRKRRVEEARRAARKRDTEREAREFGELMERQRRNRFFKKSN